MNLKKYLFFSIIILACQTEPEYEGCMDPNSCNYMSFATINAYCDFSCLDCEGIPYGSAYEDMCGYCDDDISNDCIQDCSGVWGGDLINDECGVCGGIGPLFECIDGSLVCNENNCP